jgi:hypothetical protein|tara:strand:- start:353 stop:535 length:183 start_codon:yes stop_codon:yes gene_type:complete
MEHIIHDLRNIGKEIDRLIAGREDAHRMLSFALSLLTDEQMREYTDFVGGVHIYETEGDE